VRLSVRAKLFGSAGVLLVLMTAVGVLAIVNLASVNAKGGSMYADRVVPIRDLAQVRALLGDIDSQIQRAITDQSAENRELYPKTSEADAVQMDELVEAYEATFLVQEEKDGLVAYHADWDAYQAAFREVLDRAGAGDVDGAVAAYFAKAAPLYASVDGDVAKLIDVNDQVAKQLNAEIASTYSSSKLLTIVVLAVAIVVGLGISFWMARGIIRAIGRLVGAAETVAGGDLTVEVDTSAKDELGDLARAFQRMVEGMRGMVGRVAEAATILGATSKQLASSSEETGRAVGEIANAVGDVASGAERQVRMVESAKSSAEEMARAVETSAETAARTASAAAEARTVAEEGVASVEEATSAMAAVRESSGAVTEAIRELGAKSEQIGGIVETITGIAGQTNLLALNAAIEAARAGEQGKGFAVVAEEVRKLAEESQQAAASIASLIEEIQQETRRAVEVVEDGARRTEDGAAVVERARAAFLRIGDSVAGMAGLVEDIAAAAKDVATGTATVQESMSEVAAVAEQSSASTEQVSASTEETSASTQQIAASAQELASTATELERLVGAFRV
jgi:methyl-accepting chemotaxis protein